MASLGGDILKRYKIDKKKSRKDFTKNVKKTHKKNSFSGSRRGGYRM